VAQLGQVLLKKAMQVLAGFYNKPLESFLQVLGPRWSQMNPPKKRNFNHWHFPNHRKFKMLAFDGSLVCLNR
jgi:hypothetical protein